MSRLATQIRSLMNSAPAEISLEGEALNKRLERCFIVLEGLQVCADQAGVYMSGSGKSDVPLSPELKGKALKWADAADALSEGENDLRTDDITDSVSWESIAISMESDNIILRILEAIGKAIAAVFRFIFDLLTGQPRKSEKIKKEYDDIAAHFRGMNGVSKASDGTITLEQTSLRAVHSLAIGNKLGNDSELVSSLHEADQFVAKVDEFYRKAINGVFRDMVSASKSASMNAGVVSSTSDDPHATDLILQVKKSLSDLCHACGVEGFQVTRDETLVAGRFTHHFREARSRPYPGNYVVAVKAHYADEVKSPLEALIYLSHMRLMLETAHAPIESRSFHFTLSGVEHTVSVGRDLLTKTNKLAELVPDLKKLHNEIDALIQDVKHKAEQGGESGNHLHAETVKSYLGYMVTHVAMNLKFIASITKYANHVNDATLTLLRECKAAHHSVQ